MDLPRRAKIARWNMKAILRYQLNVSKAKGVLLDLGQAFFIHIDGGGLLPELVLLGLNDLSGIQTTFENANAFQGGAGYVPLQILGTFFPLIQRTQ